MKEAFYDKYLSSKVSTILVKILDVDKDFVDALASARGEDARILRRILVFGFGPMAEKEYQTMRNELFLYGGGEHIVNAIWGFDRR